MATVVIVSCALCSVYLRESVPSFVHNHQVCEKPPESSGLLRHGEPYLKAQRRDSGARAATPGQRCVQHLTSPSLVP